MKNTGSQGQCSGVLREILRYLVEHPDAKDTVEGILKWWLPKSLGRKGTREVREAVNILVFGRGWLTERAVGSVEKIYGLNKERLEMVEEFLRHPECGK